MAPSLCRVLARRALAISIHLVPAVLSAASGEPPVRNGIYHGRNGQVAVAIPKVTEAVKIDGTLAPNEWSGAALLTGFSQYQPVDRSAADDSTEVFVMYSDFALYVAIRAFEPHGRVVQTVADSAPRREVDIRRGWVLGAPSARWVTARGEASP